MLGFSKATVLPQTLYFHQNNYLGLPCGTVDKNLSANAEHTGSIPGLGRLRMPHSS